ncbi:MAG: helix-turn-helix transcriptional regulator [Vicinamibacterales bacterium]
MHVIAYFRHERNIGQTALARKSGLRQTVVSLIERGRLSPSAHELERIANALGVSADDIAHGRVVFERTTTQEDNTAIGAVRD